MEQLDLFGAPMGARRKVRARQTQIEAYHKIKASGLLSKRRMQVYKWLYFNGPATTREALNGAGLEFRHSGRFTELEQMGLIEEVAQVKCKTTGHMVTQYDTTGKSTVGKLPKKHNRISLREVQAVELLRQVRRACYNQAAEIDVGLLDAIDDFLD